MSNFRNEWQNMLANYNEALEEYNTEIIVNNDEGFYSVQIRYPNDEMENFAENYYENELEGCVREAYYEALEVVEKADKEQTIELIVDGEKKTEIKCNKEDIDSVAEILSQLGRYAAFHNYNFQFNSK